MLKDNIHSFTLDYTHTKRWGSVKVFIFITLFFKISHGDLLKKRKEREIKYTTDGPTDSLFLNDLIKILVRLGMTWTRTGKSLKRRFNASESYQLVKLRLKPQRLETMKLYIHTHQRQTMYMDSPKNSLTQIPLIFRIFLFLSKSFYTLTLVAEMLWQASHWSPP